MLAALVLVLHDTPASLRNLGLGVCAGVGSADLEHNVVAIGLGIGPMFAARLGLTRVTLAGTEAADKREADRTRLLFIPAANARIELELGVDEVRVDRRVGVVWERDVAQQAELPGNVQVGHSKRGDVELDDFGEERDENAICVLPISNLLLFDSSSNYLESITYTKRIFKPKVEEAIVTHELRLSSAGSACTANIASGESVSNIDECQVDGIVILMGLADLVHVLASLALLGSGVRRERCTEIDERLDVGGDRVVVEVVIGVATLVELVEALSGEKDMRELGLKRHLLTPPCGLAVVMMRDVPREGKVKRVVMVPSTSWPHVLRVDALTLVVVATEGKELVLVDLLLLVLITFRVGGGGHTTSSPVGGHIVRLACEDLLRREDVDLAGGADRRNRASRHIESNWSGDAWSGAWSGKRGRW